MTIAGAVLAAGGGTRFVGAEHKLLADFNGRPVVSWVIEAALEADFDQLYVITGAADLTDLLPADVTAVANEQWADGQASSIGVAIDRAEADGHDSLVVGLGDQPLVPSSAWRSVGAAAGVIVTATFDGSRRPPVRLQSSIWSEISRSGDLGASTLMRQRPELVSEVPCMGNPADIDTVEDLRRWS